MIHRSDTLVQRMRAVLPIALIALTLVLASLPHTAKAAEERGSLAVSATAVIQAAPDMAKFQVGVQTRAETVEEARYQNALAVDGIRTALFAEGATEKDLKTTAFSVSPEWQYDPTDGSRTLIGYRVTHSIEVTVLDLDQLGPWLDAAMAQGANQVSGPTFGIKNPESLEAEALAEAVRRARAKADVLARASGVYIKGVRHISEYVALPMSAPMPSAYMAMDAMVERAATPISTGELTVTATVSITFDI